MTARREWGCEGDLNSPTGLSSPLSQPNVVCARTGECQGEGVHVLKETGAPTMPPGTAAAKRDGSLCCVAR